MNQLINEQDCTVTISPHMKAEIVTYLYLEQPAAAARFLLKTGMTSSEIKAYFARFGLNKAIVKRTNIKNRMMKKDVWLLHLINQEVAVEFVMRADNCSESDALKYINFCKPPKLKIKELFGLTREACLEKEGCAPTTQEALAVVEAHGLLPNRITRRVDRYGCITVYGQHYYLGIDPDSVVTVEIVNGEPEVSLNGQPVKVLSQGIPTCSFSEKDQVCQSRREEI